MRKNGWVACVVEHWNHHVQIRQDFAGFADVLAFRAGTPGVLAIQCTTQPNARARLKKICAEPRAAEWVAANNRIEIHGWKKTEHGTKVRWNLVVTKITAGGQNDGVHS